MVAVNDNLTGFVATPEEKEAIFICKLTMKNVQTIDFRHNYAISSEEKRKRR